MTRESRLFHCHLHLERNNDSTEQAQFDFNKVQYKLKHVLDEINPFCTKIILAQQLEILSLSDNWRNDTEVSLPNMSMTECHIY